MAYIWKNNVEVFKDTRKMSQTVYKEDTDMLQENTLVYSDADSLIDDSEMYFRDDMKIKIISGGSVSTAYDIVGPDCCVALLNFADAKRPGGWVVEGAPTQEENICRCTNLYETLTQPMCKENYYNVNLKAGVPDADAHYNEQYTDAMIYAEDVAIFKDDVTYRDIEVKHVDIITSPAPCGYVKNVEKILIHRMRGIVKAAYMHGVTHLILGAWGCGAFGQNPNVVARCFKKVLMELPVFDTVIFAIRQTGATDKEVVKDEVFIAFENAFKKSLFPIKKRT